MTNEYDVFISFKHLDKTGRPTRDAALALEIYEFLTSKSLKVFFSERSLEKLGAAAYKRAIDDALDVAHTLVAVGTSAENLGSQWVRYEWDSFVSDILNEVKPYGRVFVYLEGADSASLPRALRQSQAFVHGAESMERLYNFIVNALDENSTKSRKLQNVSSGTDHSKIELEHDDELLTSTQRKILIYLVDGPCSFSEIMQALRKLFYSETRTSVVRELVSDLASRNLILERRDDEKYELTQLGLSYVSKCD